MGNQFAPENSGIALADVERYIDEQVYTLPGAESAREAFTVLLTGSRATGTYSQTSDVDISVVCPQSVYDKVLRASLDAGIITTPKSFFAKRPDTDWGHYFGSEKGRTHFSVNSLRHVADHFTDYRDVWLWVWTTAKIIRDPNGQFGCIIDAFDGYPQDVLVRKIKYHWLLAGYWSIDVYPLSSHEDDTLHPAAMGLLNTVNELMKVCFLVEGKPFPYSEKLMRLVDTTRTGRQVQPILQKAVDLVLGRKDGERQLWERLEDGFRILNCYDESEENRQLYDVLTVALREAGVSPDWVKADYANIDELLLGELGPVPD
jgi:hypothetical protein